MALISLLEILIKHSRIKQYLIYIAIFNVVPRNSPMNFFIFSVMEYTARNY